MRLTLITLFAVLLSCSFSAQAKLYKWIDENGQIHFGDKVPVKHLVKEYDELNEQGVVTKHQEAAKTAEEKVEEQRVQREREIAELIEKKKKQRDRVLLDTYTTERDLIVARDSRMEAVDAQIKLANTIVNDSTNKVAAMEERVSQIKESNREVPTELYKQIENERQQVVVQTRVLENHIKHRDIISAQFNDYIERFKVLKGRQRARK